MPILPSLIGMPGRVCAGVFGVDLQETVYALDTTTIDLCLSVFPWAVFRTAKAAIKLHTLLDLRATSHLHSTLVMARALRSTSSTNCCPSRRFYIMDRAFLDFGPYRFHEPAAFFVTVQVEPQGPTALLASGRSQKPG